MDNALDLLAFTINEFDLDTFEGVETQFTPVEFFLHENYNPENIENDLCLLRIDQDIDLSNPDIAPACISTRNPPVGRRCFVAGWGATSEGGDRATVLQEIEGKG